MEITRDFVVSLLRQADYDAEFDLRLRARADAVSPVLEEVARGDAAEANSAMRKNAVAMLGTAGNDGSVDVLAPLLADERPELRANAIRSLGRISTPRAAVYAMR